jgi:hypothetical protein
VNWLQSRLPNGANQLRSHDRRVRVPFLLPKGAGKIWCPYFFEIFRGASNFSNPHSPIRNVEYRFALAITMNAKRYSSLLIGEC